MPATVDRPAASVTPHKHWIRQIGSAEPVPRIRRIGIPAIPVVGTEIGQGRHRSVCADEVVAGQQLAGQLRMVKAHAGIQHGNDQIRVA